ncbi:hypothetical protein MJO29_008912, partial [Puccinia striiformis f. sp. tritici]
RYVAGLRGSPAVRAAQHAEPPSSSLYKTVSQRRAAFLQPSPLPQPHQTRKREKMDPAPQVIVIQIKQGKEIGGGNHYCIICRAPQPSGNTGPPSSNHHLFHNLTRQKKREKMDPAPQVVVIQIKQGKEIGGGNHYCIICRVDPPNKKEKRWIRPQKSLLSRSSRVRRLVVVTTIVLSAALPLQPVWGGLPLCAQHNMLSPPPVPYIRPSVNTGPPSSNHHLFHNLTRHKKREKMDPAPQIVVIQIKQGKEIGGGNHYCIICRAPQEKMDPAPQVVVVQIKQGKEIGGDRKREKMDPAPQIVVIQIKQGKEIGGGNHYCIICRAPQ